MRALKQAVLDRNTNQTEAINSGLRLWLDARPARSVDDDLCAGDRKLIADIAAMARGGECAQALDIIRRVVALAKRTTTAESGTREEI